MIDLDVSPDIPAYLCYGLVFLLGVGVAWWQIRSLLAGINGIFGYAKANLLVLLYTLIPVLLFWFLDRTGAIRDTSIFAALLVGVGYPNIIAGKSGSIRSSADLSWFSAPFQVLVDSVVESVREAESQKIRHDERRMIAAIAEDDRKFTKFIDLVRLHGADIKAVAGILNGIEDRPGQYVSPITREIEVRRLYGMLLSVVDFQKLTESIYVDRHPKGPAGVSDAFRQILDFVRRMLAIGAAQFAFLVVVLITAYVWKGSPKPDYLIWRIAKPNTSDADQYRFRKDYLQDVLYSKDRKPEDVVNPLAALLSDPRLPIDRVDQILSVLEQAGAAGRGTCETAEALIVALYVANTDVRRRVHEALGGMATARKVSPDPERDNWDATRAISMRELETLIALWRKAWLTYGCASNAH